MLRIDVNGQSTATPGANDILLARVAEALRKGGASNVEIERE